MKKREVVKCKHCEKEFNSLVVRKSVFCSVNCYKIWRSLNHKEQIRPRVRKDKPPQPKCKFCGKEFLDPKKRGGHVAHCKKNPNYNLNIKNLSNSRKGKHHTDEQRAHLSRKRIEWLNKNPDKVPYVVNHSSKVSFPEQLMYNALLLMYDKALWEHRYRIGRYEFDFAFPGYKLDVEVDGQTHQTEKVKAIDSRRDEYSRSLGWKVLRLDAMLVKNDIIKCLGLIGAALKEVEDEDSCYKS